MHVSRDNKATNLIIAGEKRARPRNHVLFVLMGLASFAYLFNTFVVFTVPLSAISEAPLIFQRIFETFRSPYLLLVLYLCSMLELFALSRTYSYLKSAIGKRRML
jgi:hypothetical protein